MKPTTPEEERIIRERDDRAGEPSEDAAVLRGEVSAHVLERQLGGLSCEDNVTPTEIMTECVTISLDKNSILIRPG